MMCDRRRTAGWTTPVLRTTNQRDLTAKDLRIAMGPISERNIVHRKTPGCCGYSSTCYFVLLADLQNVAFRLPGPPPTSLPRLGYRRFPSIRSPSHAFCNLRVQIFLVVRQGAETSCIVSHPGLRLERTNYDAKHEAHRHECSKLRAAPTENKSLLLT